jgi:GAF domain-containing protein
LPLIVGERVIGVLDVQSTEEAAFSDEDVATLQTMADQVALAIEHARVLEESRRALRELEAIYGQRVHEAWGERAARQSMGYRYTGLGVKPVPDLVLAEMGSTPLERWPVVLQEADGRRLVAPIRLRGQTLGSVVLRQDAEGEPWSEDDVALVEELVTQVGLALENARLLEETRRRAEWEQSLSQLTARFSRSLDLDTMLQAAVRELGQLPNVAEVSVHMGVPEEQPAVGQHDEADGPHVSEQL